MCLSRSLTVLKHFGGSAAHNVQTWSFFAWKETPLYDESKPGEVLVMPW